MSDESPPPPLRLKPRARPEGESVDAVPATQTTANVTGSETVAPENEAPRLRLRPKLDTAALTESPTAPASTETVQVPAAVPFTLRPRTPEPASDNSNVAPASIPPAPVLFRPAEPEAAPSIEPPKFKLKEKPAVPATPVESAVVAPPSVPPPIPARTEQAPASDSVKPLGKPAPKLTVALPPPVPKINDKLPTKNGSKSSSGRRTLPAGLLYTLVVILLAAAYFGYRKFRPISASAPAPVVAAAATPSTSPQKTAEAPKRPSTPSATLNELSAIPARAIAKAQATVDMVRATEQGRVEAVTDGDTASAMPVRRPAPKPPKPVVAATSTTQLSPGLTATTTATDVAGDASPAFRNWVAQARISGVFKGTPPRVLINGRTVPAGQMVDEVLEITFEGIDALGKSLVFRDKTNATVQRKF